MYSMQELQGVTRSSSMQITALPIEHTWGKVNLIPNLPNFLLTFPSLFWRQHWPLWHLEIGLATVFLSALLPWCFIYGGISARASHNPSELKLRLKSLSVPQEITMSSSRLWRWTEVSCRCWWSSRLDLSRVPHSLSAKLPASIVRFILLLRLCLSFKHERLNRITKYH